jgi:hypothetical protein
VEPINPCVTNTPIRTSPFRQPNFGRRKTIGSTSTQGTTTGGASAESIALGAYGYVNLIIHVSLILKVNKNLY